jgi:AraC-like DNA-binding protein
MDNAAGKGWESFLHYLPYSEEDKKWGMVCTTAGTARIPPRTAYPSNPNEHPAPFRTVATGRILPEFQMVYITNGEGIFGTGDKTYRVLPGTLLLVLPGIKHYYRPVFAYGWDEYWVGFKGEYFSRLAEEGILSRDHVFFEIGLHDHLLFLFDQIFDEVKNQRPLYQLKACSGVLTLMAEVLSFERRKDQPNYYQKIVEKAKYLMASNIYNVMNLSNISEQLGISASRFNEIFKTYTAMTPYQYYIHIKIHKAESLLEQDIPIKEVAYRLGFEDQYYFSRLFKNKAGISPSAWKKSFYPRAPLSREETIL